MPDGGVVVSAKTKLRDAGRNFVHRVAPAVIDSATEVPHLQQRVKRLQGAVQAMRGELRNLRAEVQTLREEVQETRRLHQRVAELTDIVADVLVAAADKDDPRIQRALDEFAERSF